MKHLFTADLHLTARATDEYRLEIFPWLERQCVNRGIDYLWILGDLTDQKDAHPAALVTRMVKGLRRLARRVRKVLVLKGNHDYLDPRNPFFGFVDGMGGSILYFSRPTEIGLYQQRFLCLPHGPPEDWGHYDQSLYDAVLWHGAIRGGHYENGVRPNKEGLEVSHFARANLVIAGDLHVPQERNGKIFYCGAPHPLRFGDHFKPRVLLLDGADLRSIARTTIKKAQVIADGQSVRAALDDARLTAGDRVRLTAVLPRADFVTWELTKRATEHWCRARGVELAGIKLQEAEERKRMKAPASAPARRPDETLRRYAAARGLAPETLDAGLGILEAGIKE